MGTIGLVVFDVAGTTVADDGGQVARCFVEALSAAGVEVASADVDLVMGLAKPEAIRRLLGRSGAPVLEPVVESIHAGFLARMIDHYRNAPGIVEIPGARATFRILRRAGVRVALDTGFSRPILNTVLRRLGWRIGADIDATVASDEVDGGRPAPDMIHEAMRRTVVVEPKYVAKVGDTPFDLQEGANARCKLVIGVTSGTYSAEGLRAHPHTHIVASIEDIPAIVLSQTSRCSEGA